MMWRIPEDAFYKVGIGQSEGILTISSIEVADITGQFKEAV